MNTAEFKTLDPMHPSVDVLLVVPERFKCNKCHGSDGNRYGKILSQQHKKRFCIPRALLRLFVRKHVQTRGVTVALTNSAATLNLPKLREVLFSMQQLTTKKLSEPLVSVRIW